MSDDVDLDAREDEGLSEYDEEEDSDDSEEQPDDGKISCSSPCCP